MYLKDKLTIPHGSRLVAKYLQSIKSIMDELVLIDVLVTKVDAINHILNGIGSEFKELSITIRGIEKLYDKFINYEEFLKKQDNHSETLVIITNYTHHLIGRNQGNSKNFSNQNFSNKSRYT